MSVVKKPIWAKDNFALGEWIYLCCRACDDEYDPYEAESFEAEGEPTISYWQLSKSGPYNSSEANISVDFEGRKFAGKISEFDDEGNQVFGVESFDAEVKDRHPTLSKKAKSEYVFPERKAYPIGDERHAMLALVYSTWPNNKKDASEVRRKVFQRYPQLRTEFMDGKYETRNAESLEDYTPEELATSNVNVGDITVDAGKGGYGAEEGGKCSCCGNKIVNGSCGCPSDCPHCGGRPLDSETFDADWDNAPYGSWDEAWSDEISFPMGEKPERLWLKNLSVIAIFAGAIWVGKQTRK